MNDFAIGRDASSCVRISMDKRAHNAARDSGRWARSGGMGRGITAQCGREISAVPIEMVRDAGHPNDPTPTFSITHLDFVSFYPPLIHHGRDDDSQTSP